jgi:hypothetical protein
MKSAVHLIQLELLEQQAQREAAEAGMTFAKQPSREAQNTFLLDSHRAAMRFENWFVMGWEHSSWLDQ